MVLPNAEAQVSNDDIYLPCAATCGIRLCQGPVEHKDAGGLFEKEME